MKALLELEGVNTFYGAAHVLHDMRLKVDPGERIALIGRNGVGKTTVVNAILGLATTRSGRITLGDHVLHKPRPYAAAQHGIAVVPQGRRIVVNLSVEENLILGAAVRRKGPWALGAIYALFPILKERAHAPGTALSGGQQQMLAIGRALMANPSLVLLDEPSEGLAPVMIDHLAAIFRQVAEQGTALLLIEQNIGLVMRVARRYVAMAKGSVVAEGDVDEENIGQLDQLVMV